MLSNKRLNEHENNSAGAIVLKDELPVWLFFHFFPFPIFFLFQAHFSTAETHDNPVVSFTAFSDSMKLSEEVAIFPETHLKK